MGIGGQTSAGIAGADNRNSARSELLGGGNSGRAGAVFHRTCGVGSFVLQIEGFDSKRARQTRGGNQGCRAFAQSNDMGGIPNRQNFMKAPHSLESVIRQIGPTGLAQVIDQVEQSSALSTLQQVLKIESFSTIKTNQPSNPRECHRLAKRKQVGLIVLLPSSGSSKFDRCFAFKYHGRCHYEKR